MPPQVLSAGFIIPEVAVLQVLFYFLSSLSQYQSPIYNLCIFREVGKLCTVVIIIINRVISCTILIKCSCYCKACCAKRLFFSVLLKQLLQPSAKGLTSVPSKHLVKVFIVDRHEVSYLYPVSFSAQRALVL